MKRKQSHFYTCLLAGVLALMMLAGCVSMKTAGSGSSVGSLGTNSTAEIGTTQTSAAAEQTVNAETSATTEDSSKAEASTEASASGNSAADSEAIAIAVEDNQTVEITEAGTYSFTGTAENYTIRVDVDKEEKVWIILDGVTVTNEDAPVIYVVSADKVHVVTTGAASTLTVTGTFAADGETNLDAVIFAKDDLELEGDGELTIVSATANGIACKNDLEFTSGTYSIEAAEDAVEANDSITVDDGALTIVSGKDGIHCENDEDDALGSIEINGGSLKIQVSDDGIQAQSTLTINGGDLEITAGEGLEATSIEINDGTITIAAYDDGINASNKSTAYTTQIVINGGEISVTMAQGDTDAIDSNGNLYFNGGTVNITAQFAFDYDGIGQLNGGTVIVNGSQINQLSNSMMGGGGFGGQGGFGGRP